MRIHHLALRTRQVEALERFYGELLGIAVETRPRPEALWLRAGDVLLMLEEAPPNEELPSGNTQELIAFEVDAASLETWRGRLHDAGVSVESETDYTIYFRDPDGRRVALSHYPNPRLRRFG